MSLLNDALRKKRSEQQAPQNALKASLPKLNGKSKGKSKRHWKIVAGGLVLSAVACGMWLYFDLSSGPPDLSASPPSAGITDGIQPMDHGVGQADGEENDAPPIMASVEPPTPAAPLSKASKPLIQTKQQTQTKAQPPMKAKRTPAKAPPKVKASQGSQKKPGKRAALKHRSPPRKKRIAKAKPSAGTPAGLTVQSDRLYQKARQYHRQNHIEKAIALYQEVLRINPEHDKARFNLSSAYLQTKAYDQAYPIVADLYAKEPDNQQVMLNLAIAHIGCRRYPKALDLLNKASGRPDALLFEIAFHKGVAYSHLNQIETALTWYKQAETIRPDDPRLLFNLALVYDQQAQFGAAADYYRRYLAQQPEIDALEKRQIRRRIRTLLTYREQFQREKTQR